MLWVALTAKAHSVLWIVPPWKLKPGRFQTLDPKQRGHHPAQCAHRKIQVQREVSGGKKKSRKKRKRKISWKHQTETQLLVRQSRNVLTTGHTCVLSRKLSTEVPGSAMGEVVLPWDGRDFGQQTSSKNRVCPVTAEDGNIYLPIWNTFNADWSRSQLVSHLLWWGSNSHRSFSALTHPLPPQLLYQQDWEHWFPQLSASRPKQMTETENSEGATQLCEELQWWFGNKNSKTSLQKSYGHGKDREICPWIELNILIYHSDGPLWAMGIQERMKRSWRYK